MNPKQQVLKNALNISHHLVIPIADNSQPQFIQEPGSLTIKIGLVGMVMPVDLDHKPQLRAVKIDDEIANRFLTQEFILGKLSHAQHMPHPDFGGGWIFAVFAR